MSEHDRVREAIAAYALDAFDGDDRARVERELLEHLPGCAECSATMRDFRDVAGDIALTTEPIAPSAALEQRLFEAARGARAVEPPVEIATRRRRLAARAVAVAAAVMLVGSTALNVALVREFDDAQRDRDATAALVQAASDPRSTSVALRGQAGVVSIIYRPGGTAVLVAESLPAPPVGHVYELWFLNGDAVPIGTFTPEQGRVVLPLSKSPHSYRGVAITVEKGFVNEPTTDPIYAATLEA